MEQTQPGQERFASRICSEVSQPFQKHMNRRGMRVFLRRLPALIGIRVILEPDDGLGERQPTAISVASAQAYYRIPG
jgi:hypothetical protein